MTLFNNLGISAINWVNENETLFDLDYSCQDMLSEMSNLGFKTTELSRKFSRDADKLKKQLKQYGLTLTSGWISVHFSDQKLRESEMKKYKEHVNFLKSVGCKHVVTCEERDAFTGVNGEKVIPLTDEEWGHMVEGLHEAAKYCKENDMQLVYHFHGETVVETPSEIQRFIESTDPDLIHVLYDTGHIYYSGNDPLAILKKYFDRIKYIHLKDVRQEVLDWKNENQVKLVEGVKKGIFTVPGDGCIDFSPIIKELENRRYDGPIIIEAEQNPAIANPYEYALKSKEYLKGILDS